ncbi:MAG: peptidyl-prolyl cis-trans isomerase [Treponema sp.]|nr:peptidyl-prolyl cis-trans isomerase [Treponema sp.]
MKKGVMYTAGSIIILIICLIAFVLPTTLGKAANQKPLEFGSYNGRKITYEQGSDFADFVSQYAEMYRSQGIQIDSSQQYYLFQYAFNSTVMKYAYEDAVKKSGWKVPKEAVNRKLRPYFYDENGKFSSKLYKQADPSSVEKLRQNIEGNLYTSRFNDDIFGSSSEFLGIDNLYGVKIADPELKFFQNYGTEKRGFNMVAYKKADYPEAEKMKYAENNKAKFINYDMLIITVDEKSLAEKVAKRIGKEEITFEDAVAEYSENNYSNTEGKLSSTYQYQLENILNDKADLAKLTDLAVGAVSPVIQTTSGYSIFKANAAPVQPDFENEEMKSRVSNYLTSYESGLIEDYYIAQANMFKSEAKASSFDDACAKLGVEKTEIAPFPLNFGNTSVTGTVDTSVTGLRGADTNENFLKEAFSLKLNDYSEPLVMSDYVIVIQYTTSENAEISDDDKPTIINTIVNSDNSSAQRALMDSPKLDNKFIATYYSNLL